MTYRTQFLVMMVLYATVTAVLFYWFNLFMEISYDMKPAPIAYSDHR